MLKYGLALIGLVFCLQGNAQQCFCLKWAKPNGFLLKMQLQDDDWQMGTVQYQGQRGTVAIRLVNSKELARNEGRPSYIQYTFDEWAEGKRTGTYIICIQGAVVYDSWYLRRKDGKKFRLERVPKENDCADCLH